MINIIDKTIENHQNLERPQNPSMIIMHYTAVSFKETDAFFSKTQLDNGTLAHYVIDENGNTYKYLENNFVGKQAGISYWNGLDNINLYSIGIENVNQGHTAENKGDGVLLYGEFYYHFPETQIQNLVELTVNLIEDYHIKPYNIVGHSDVAINAGRKADPGPLFPWEKLAKEYGIGLWYNLSLTKNEFSNVEHTIKNLSNEDKQGLFINKLIEFGYGPPFLVPNTTIDNPYGIQETKDRYKIDNNAKNLIKNYNMHYRPDKGISYSIDDKDFEIINSLNILKNLTKNNDFSLEQLKEMYTVNDINQDYFTSHDINISSIDDSVNFKFLTIN